MSQKSFATAIGCIDGRAAIPTLQFLQNYLQVDHVDFVTSAGPDKAFLQGEPAKIEEMKRQVAISLNAHHSKIITIVAHHDCAGNPISREEHFAMLSACVKEIEQWNHDVRVLSLWINEKWQAEVISDSWDANTKAA